MEKTVATISIWLKLCVYKICWHWLLIAVSLMCWAVCPDCPLLILTDHYGKIQAAAYTATLRLTLSLLHQPHASGIMSHTQEGANDICTTYLALHPTVLYSTSLEVWSAKDTSVWTDNMQWYLTSVKPQGVFLSLTIVLFITFTRLWSRHCDLNQGNSRQ